MADIVSSKTISAQRTELVVVHQHCPSRPYLELQVPDDFHAYRCITYTIGSRDQGYKDRPGSGRWSWFTASVRRPHGRGNLTTVAVCENQQAVPDFFTHLIKWPAADPWGINWKPWITALAPGDVIELVPRAMYQGWLNIIKNAKIELEYEPAAPSQLTKGGAYLAFRLNAHLYLRQLEVQAREIRVLAIQPGHHDDPVICRFRYVRLGDEASRHQHYDALSYSWGYPKQLATITLRPGSTGDQAQHDLSITPSAENAIRRLRHKSHVIDLWIDAVCIRQDDLQERAQQVSMMTTIYERSQTVHVWLGEHVGTEFALQLVRDVHNYNHRVCKGGDKCLCEGTQHSPAEVIEAAVQENESPKYRGLRPIFCHYQQRFGEQLVPYAGGVGRNSIHQLFSQLFDNAWFRRSWVLREVLFAQSVMVHCGPQMVTWAEVVDLNSWITAPEFLGSAPHDIFASVTMPSPWQNLQVSKSRKKMASPETMRTDAQQSVLEVYLSSLNLQSTEARDKLFAVLPFGRETSNQEHLPAELRPNYVKSEQQVFADFTNWWIRRYRSLGILSTIHGHRDRTWVRVVCDMQKDIPVQRPTWTVPTEGAQSWCQATLSNLFEFQASGSTEPETFLLDHSSLDASTRVLEIRLKGYRIGIIQTTGHDLTASMKTLKTEISEFSRVSYRIVDPSGIYEHWKMRRTSRDTESDDEATRKRLQDHYGGHQIYRHLARMNDAPDEQRYGPTKDMYMCHDPWIFSLDNGMFGIAPWRARKGDLVVLLHGGATPFLLHETEEEGGNTAFELVGECFLSGAMHGKVMQEFLAQGKESEVFTLV